MARGRKAAGRRGAGGGRFRPIPGRGSAKGRGRGRGRGKGSSVGNFLRPRTGRQAGRVANAEASAEYNPEIRQMRQDARGSRKREKDLGAWYGDLANDYAQAQSAGQAAFTATQDAIAKQLAEASQRSGEQLSTLSKDDEEFAKLVGGPKDTAGLAEIAKAGAAAERARVSMNAPTAQEAANFQAALGGYKAAAKMQGIEARRDERSRRDKIRSDLAAVRKEKGAARVARKEEIRAADRDYSLQLKQMRMARQEAKTAAQQAAADAEIARIEAAQQARQEATDNRQEQERIGISRRNARTSERSQRETARNNRAGGGMTPTQRREAKREAASATITARNLYKAAKRPPKTASEWAAFVQLVAAEEGIDPVAAQKAVAKLRKQRAAKKGLTYSQRARRGEVAGPPAPKRRKVR